MMSLLLTECNVIPAFIVTSTVALIIVDVLGMMGWIGISLNNILLVIVFMVNIVLKYLIVNCGKCVLLIPRPLVCLLSFVHILCDALPTHQVAIKWRELKMQLLTWALWYIT